MQRQRPSLKVLLVVLALIIVSVELLLFRGRHSFDLGDGSFTPTVHKTPAVVGPVPPRVYKALGPEDLPCVTELMGNPNRGRPGDNTFNLYDKNQNTQRGFLYMKPPKCASTTLAGVNMRIARNVARRRNLSVPMCDMSFNHGGHLKGRRFRARDHKRSYLWTMIREPTARHVSFFWFWHVSALKRDSSDASMTEFLMKQFPDYYFTYLSPRYDSHNWAAGPGQGRNSTLNKTEIIDEVGYVLNEYDFIGITEKLDQSLVVIMMLMDLPMADILYYTAKAVDNFYIDPGTRNKCITLKPASVSDGMKDFLASDTWKDRIYSDDLLYRVADQSLEMTIDSLGRKEVDANVAKLKHAQSVVVERCRGKVRMECEVEGEPPRKDFDCYWHDVGCGMSCLDQVATELSLW